MQTTERLRLALLLLRLIVFGVMLMWTLDKFLNPQHSASVYQHFYMIGGLGAQQMIALGGLEMLLLLAFVLGVWKRLTYGAVLLLHAVSTLSSYKQYFAPFDRGNLLFFAAWPMLAACLALYLLRDEDRLLSMG
jgi:putative oxidoreductase